MKNTKQTITQRANQRKEEKKHKLSFFERFSSVVTKASGSTAAFVVAISAIIIWLMTGPIFNFSDTWQLIINTGTTIVTFLMVFLIQRAQNKDSLALHLKLNELIAAQERANNHLISVEDISEEELMVLRNFYGELAKLSEDELPIEESHSIEKVDNYHEWKKSTLDIYRQKLQETSEARANAKKD